MMSYPAYVQTLVSVEDTRWTDGENDGKRLKETDEEREREREC